VYVHGKCSDGYVAPSMHQLVCLLDAAADDDRLNGALLADMMTCLLCARKIEVAARRVDESATAFVHEAASI